MDEKKKDERLRSPVELSEPETMNTTTTNIRAIAQDARHTTIPVYLAHTWTGKKKLYVVTITILVILNTTLSSALPSGSTASLEERFHAPEHQLPLSTACFLVGYIFGPIVFGPLSETMGRRPSLIIAFGLYSIFAMACALAPSWEAFLAFRVIEGSGASGPMTILSGLYSDLFEDLKARGRAVTLFNLATHLGPLSGPVLASHIEVAGWQWPFWAALILAGILWPGLLLMPETYGPVLLRRNPNLSLRVKEQVGVVSNRHVRRLKFVMVEVLFRPFTMLREPIVFFTNLYLAMIYALFYLYFRAFYIIFTDVYGMSARATSLTFIPLGIGAFTAALVFLWYDDYLLKEQAKGKVWASIEESRRLGMACVGGPLVAVTQFWLGWTARPDIHWIAPVTSGFVCGLGMEFIMMGLSNYLTDVYGIYSASVFAICIFTRSALAVLMLALAVDPLYEHLGVARACTILGAVCVAMSAIPWVFIKYGAVLKRKSPFCQKLLIDGRRIDPGTSIDPENSSFG